MGAARVISKWNGPGTVKVIVADQDLQPATAAVAAACSAHIEAERPVGPAVTVEAAGALEVTVEAAAVLDGSASRTGVRDALEEAVRAYLKSLAAAAFSGNVDLQLEPLEAGNYEVLFNRIAFLLLSIPGVLDYGTLKLCGGTENLTVPAGSVPVLKEVRVT